MKKKKMETLKDQFLKAWCPNGIKEVKTRGVKGYTFDLKSLMSPISELKGFNFERILVAYSHGYVSVGEYKDGLILLDENKYKGVWSQPDEFETFLRLNAPEMFKEQEVEQDEEDFDKNYHEHINTIC